MTSPVSSGNAAHPAYLLSKSQPLDNVLSHRHPEAGQFREVRAGPQEIAGLRAILVRDVHFGFGCKREA
jgi:hypothetical protein